MTEVKECPFCGDPMKLLSRWVLVHAKQSSSCPISTTCWHVSNIASWNKRHGIETLEAEELRKALEAIARDNQCTCLDAYSGRGLQDPHCQASNVGDDAREALGLPPVCKGAIRAALKGTPE